MDLPEPLSPHRPTTSPALSSRLTCSTARTSPPGVRYTTDRSLISRIGLTGSHLRSGSWFGLGRAVSLVLGGRPVQQRGPREGVGELPDLLRRAVSWASTGVGSVVQMRCPAIFGRAARGAQPRVADLVDAGVEQHQGGADERDREARRDPPPPRRRSAARCWSAPSTGRCRATSSSRLVSPTKASATEAPIAYSTVLTKLAAISEISLGMISKMMIRQVFSPVSRDAAMKSRFLIVSVCARITRAPHGQPRPASTMMVGVCPCVRQVAEQHDQQRQRGDHQEHVGEQGQQVVPDPAEERGGDPDEHREDRGDDARRAARRSNVSRMPVSTWESTSCAGLRGAEQVLQARVVQRELRVLVLESRVVRLQPSGR